MSFPHNSGLDIYRFIIEGIRNEDNKTGEFLKRFLDGPQEVWEQIEIRMFEFLELWDALNVEDQYLKYLKTQVGWTKDLDHITDNVDDIALRKLIINAIDIWKQRGSETIIEDIITFSTGAKNKIFNWFDYRNLVDERALGDDYWISDSIDDTPAGLSEYTMLSKIVDDGFLNRQLVVDLIALMKPSNELVQIIYHDFLDYFEIVGDDIQWITNVGEILTIEDEMMKLTGANDTGVIADVLGSDSWDQYAFSSKVNLVRPDVGYIANFSIFYQWVDDQNYRRITIGRSESNHKISFFRSVAGVEIIERGGLQLDDIGIPIHFDSFYKYQIKIITESTSQRIQIYIDENEIINQLFMTLPGGTIGFSHTLSEIQIKDVEIMPLPSDTDIVQ